MDEPSKMQEAINVLTEWSNINKLGINAEKTKEMLIYFGKRDLQLQPVKINNINLDRVHTSKLLGIIISDDLKWASHIKYIVAKASKRLYYLRELKRAGIQTSELNRVYTSMIRPVLEYCVEVWTTCLTKEQCFQVESIQRRACKIMLPNDKYEEACYTLSLPTLEERRYQMCKTTFEKIKQDNHKLNYMLVKRNELKYGLRNQYPYVKPKCTTNRFRRSFIPWCLYNLN